MLNSKYLLFVIALTSLKFLSGCSGSNSDLEKIADAQACLDTATQSTAASCAAKVEGLTSPGAYLIRCVSLFVEDGLTSAERLTSAYEGLSSGGTGSDSSLNFISYVAFISGANWTVRQATAANALNNCALSLSPGLTLLSSISSMATTIGAVSGALNSDGSINNVDGAIAAIAAGGPAAQSALGSAVITAYNSSCSSEDSGTGEFCSQFSSTIAAVGTDPQAVGAFLSDCLSTPANPGCEAFR